MRRIAGALMMVVGLAAAGCGESEEPQEPLLAHPVVEAYRESAGLDFVECGVAHSRFVSCEDHDCERRCGDEERTAFECFVAAHERCEPAHLQRQYATGTSGVILYDLFVVPGGPVGCEIVLFEDFTHLSDHCRTVSRATCGTPQIQDGPDSCWLDTYCGMPETLVEDRSDSCELN